MRNRTGMTVLMSVVFVNLFAACNARQVNSPPFFQESIFKGFVEEDDSVDLLGGFTVNSGSNLKGVVIIDQYRLRPEVSTGSVDVYIQQLLRYLRNTGWCVEKGNPIKGLGEDAYSLRLFLKKEMGDGIVLDLHFSFMKEDTVLFVSQFPAIGYSDSE